VEFLDPPAAVLFTRSRKLRVKKRRQREREREGEKRGGEKKKRAAQGQKKEQVELFRSTSEDKGLRKTQLAPAASRVRARDGFWPWRSASLNDVDPGRRGEEESWRDVEGSRPLRKGKGIKDLADFFRPT